LRRGGPRRGRPPRQDLPPAGDRAGPAADGDAAAAAAAGAAAQAAAGLPARVASGESREVAGLGRQLPMGNYPASAASTSCSSSISTPPLAATEGSNS